MLVRWSAVLVVVLGACADPDSSEVEVSSAATALTLTSPTGMLRCATVEPGIAEQDAAEAEASSRLALLRQSRGGNHRIPVHFHIITTSDGTGDVSDLVPAQMDVLNAAYARAGFKFRLASLEVVQNDVWYEANIDTPEERQMKRALRRGDAGALNIYTGINDGALLGWATFPSGYDDHPKLDGVVALDISLPGGGLEIPIDPVDEPDGFLQYSAGDTMTHEVGHWLGLFHTFDGGCTKKNDRIADTPAEAEPQFFCVDRDSCTGRKFPGTDPIHNFMDYVDDDCMDQFTTDQEDRMQNQFHAFRD